ncbi:MAG: M48 family metallopeptidase [Phormidesmis sp.]
MSPYVPKEITEEVNVTPVNPLVNLAYLMATVAFVGALVYGSLGLIATRIATRIDPKTEENIGAAMTAAISLQTAADDSRIAYLEDLLADLEANVPKTTLAEATYPPLKVSILDTEVENAMVTAGSYLFVTDGLLQKVESENELAFVLAHELGHLQHRDPLKALGRSLVWVTLSSLLGLGQGGDTIVRAANLADLSYSRGQETAADDYALELIATHYQHTDHSLGFFQRVQAEEPDWGALSKVTEWQQSHPLTGDRIRRLDRTLDEKGWTATGAATPLPELIGCKNFEPCR